MRVCVCYVSLRVCMYLYVCVYVYASAFVACLCVPVYACVFTVCRSVPVCICVSVFGSSETASSLNLDNFWFFLTDRIFRV
jgi:hypothetical protein